MTCKIWFCFSCKLKDTPCPLCKVVLKVGHHLQRGHASFPNLLDVHLQSSRKPGNIFEWLSLGKVFKWFVRRFIFLIDIFQVLWSAKVDTDNSSRTKFLYWAKLVFRVTRSHLPAGLVIPVNQVISWLSHLLIRLLFDSSFKCSTRANF